MKHRKFVHRTFNENCEIDKKMPQNTENIEKYNEMDLKVENVKSDIVLVEIVETDGKNFNFDSEKLQIKCD